MTTDTARRPASALLLASPAAAAMLALTTAWAFHHGPASSSPQPGGALPRTSAATVGLEKRLASAAADLQRSQVSVLRLETALRGRAHRLHALESGLGSTGAGLSVPGGTAGQLGSASAPVQVVPAAPRVSTSTGAS